MSATRKHLAVVVAARLLALFLYGSAIVSAAFVYGAGVIQTPAFQLLCDTVFAPLFLIDGDSDRIERLLNNAVNAYWHGFESRH